MSRGTTPDPSDDVHKLHHVGMIRLKCSDLPTIVLTRLFRCLNPLYVCSSGSNFVSCDIRIRISWIGWVCFYPLMLSIYFSFFLSLKIIIKRKYKGACSNAVCLENLLFGIRLYNLVLKKNWTYIYIYILVDRLGVHRGGMGTRVWWTATYKTHSTTGWVINGFCF